MTQQKNNTYASIIHFSQFVGYLIPFLGMILPIILWQNRKEDPYVDEHGKIVANWIITQIVYLILVIVLSFFGAGLISLLILAVCSITFTIIGGIKALNSKTWKYPMSVNFFYNIENQNLENINSPIELFSIGKKFSPTITIYNTQTLSLGKSLNCNIQIINQYLSSKHLEIAMLNNTIYINDTNSQKGTYIDGTKLINNQKTKLNKNEKLIIGSEEIIYEII